MSESKDLSSARSSSSSSASRCGNSSTPEGSRKHLKPKTPSSCSGAEVRLVAGHRSAPEPDVDERLVLGHLALAVEAVHRGGGRDAVERHVDDGGHAAGRRSPGRGGKALPLGAARLVDVDVGVHEAGEQGFVGRELNDFGAGQPGAERLDGGDPAAPDPHLARRGPRRRQDALPPDDEVEGFVRHSGSPCSLCLPSFRAPLDVTANRRGAHWGSRRRKLRRRPACPCRSAP